MADVGIQRRAVFTSFLSPFNNMHLFFSPSPITSSCLSHPLFIPLAPPSPLSVVLQQDTSMVWVTAPTPSVLSEWVQARERDPSTELALVREAVLERARRVILAEGTGRTNKREGGRGKKSMLYFVIKNKIHNHQMLGRMKGKHADGDN